MAEEQEIIQLAVRDFAGNELKPLAPKIDADAIIPAGLLAKLSAIGLFGISAPQDFGGVGALFGTLISITSELSQTSASVALTSYQHNLACYLLNEFGSEQQKSKILPKLASGKKIGAIAITEGLSSFDLDAIKTSSIERDNAPIINGMKPYVVNGSFAHIFIVMCKSASNHQFFIVKNDSKGFAQGKRIGLLGVRASGISHLYFDGVAVSKENILGTKEDAPAILRSAQVGTWLGMSAVALGIAKASLDAATKYANQRVQFGKPIGRFEAIQDMIAQIANDIETTSALLDRISKLREKGKSVWKEAATAKVVATTMATKSAKIALRIHGGYGFIKDYPVERFVRDAKTVEILGDRNDELKTATARDVLGYQ